MTVNLSDFKREENCIYKDERYTVRDNGAILRHAREGKRIRKYDDQWTFGKPNHNGYMHLSSVVIHRIVATAFHGEPPTSQHVVDHIDTNRQNNRPENLRWLTKLENTLNNPITRKRIELICGVEAFIKDPSILQNHISVDPNFGWMRTVTPEEARISLEHLNEWSKKESFINSSGGGGILGEWIFKNDTNFFPEQEVSEFVDSLTPNAIQKNWRTPSEFPYCPQGSGENSIDFYSTNLKIGKIFSRNKYSNQIILDYTTSKDGKDLWVLCESDEDDAVKPWTLAQVNYEDNLFIHTNLGSFFKKIGAEKQFTIAQGIEWTGGDSVDDFS